MAGGGGNAPAWLFSFVDLAFLLLIAMTQIAEDAPKQQPDLGELVVPRIESDATAAMPARAAERWQLRVHPPGPTPPFTLVPGAAVADSTARLDLDALAGRLRDLKSESGSKPLLAPHEDSRSQDLLDAVAALEAQWPGRRRATVSARLTVQ